MDIYVKSGLSNTFNSENRLQFQDKSCYQKPKQTKLTLAFDFDLISPPIAMDYELSIVDKKKFNKIKRLWNVTNWFQFGNW